MSNFTDGGCWKNWIVFFKITKKKKKKKKARQAQQAKSAGGRYPAEKFPEGVYQLFIDVKACIFRVGEPTDLHFSLYSHGTDRFLTEEFVLSLTENGMPPEVDMWGKIKTIFEVLLMCVCVCVCLSLLLLLFFCCLGGRGWREARICYVIYNHLFSISKKKRNNYWFSFLCVCVCVCVWQGLSHKDYDSDVYLVTSIIRKGALLYDDKNKKSNKKIVTFFFFSFVCLFQTVFEKYFF